MVVKFVVMMEIVEMVGNKGGDGYCGDGVMRWRWLVMVVDGGV